MSSCWVGRDRWARRTLRSSLRCGAPSGRARPRIAFASTHTGIPYSMKWILVLLVLTGTFASAAESATKTEPPPPLKLAPPTPGWRYEESRRFPAPEAGQGAAADRDFVYAINNFTIAKYRKATGER